MPSVNVTRTFDSPYSDTERVTTRFGRPFSSVSIGTVISRSTSSAACPGHCGRELDARRRDVGVRVDRQALQREDADADDREREQRDEQRLRDAPLRRAAGSARARASLGASRVGTRLARRSGVGSVTGSPRTEGRARHRATT